MIAAYVLSSPSNEVTADRVFAALGVVTWFAFPFIYLPHIGFFIVQVTL